MQGAGGGRPGPPLPEDLDTHDGHLSLCKGPLLPFDSGFELGPVPVSEPLAQTQRAPHSAAPVTLLWAKGGSCGSPVGKWLRSTPASSQLHSCRAAA